MAFDRAKIIAEGGKFHGADDPLVECATFTADKVAFEPVSSTGAAPLTIKEDANLPKRMVIEGVLQRFMPTGAKPQDFLNANKRIYTMERVGNRVLDPNGEVMKRIAENAMIGHLEHPESGTTDLNKGAIRILKIWAESDGTVRGRALVYNNAPGQMLQEYIATGTRVGISSRGTGTVDASGYVCEDYRLETWDMVYNPSTTGAFPALATESVTGAPEQPVREAVAKPAVESAPTSVIIPTQDKPMSLSKRISEVRSQVSNLLAVDPRKLTVESRAQYGADLIDTRVKIAEEFTGEKRVSEITKILEAIDKAKQQFEDLGVSGWRDDPAALAPTSGPASGAPGGNADAAVTGKVDQDVGAAFCALSQITGVPCTPPDAKADKMLGWKETQDAIAMVANWYGQGGGAQMPQVKSALEAILGGKMPTIESIETQQSLLREARDELISMTEREKAASAIIEEMRTHHKDLQGKMSEATAATAKASEIIADLTSVDHAGQGKPTNESVVPTPAPVAKPAVKSLAERLADRAKRSVVEGLPSGTPIESRPDAEVTKTEPATGDRKELREDHLLSVLGSSAIPRLLKG